MTTSDTCSPHGALELDEHLQSFHLKVTQPIHTNTYFYTRHKSTEKRYLHSNILIHIGTPFTKDEGIYTRFIDVERDFLLNDFCLLTMTFVGLISKLDVLKQNCLTLVLLYTMM